MISKTFIIWISICLITNIIRTIYEVLKYKKLLKPNKILFVIIFANMLLLWVSWFSMCIEDSYRFTIPEGLQYSGLTLVICGIIIFIISLFTIKSLENYEGDLVTHGIYSLIRHPMYLSFIFWLIGFAVFTASSISFIFSILVIANILFWRYLEQKELEKKFPAYADYKKRTIF